MPNHLPNIPNISVAQSANRQMISTYTGPIVEITRHADGEQRDFYAKPDGKLDTDEIATWLNGSEATCVPYNQVVSA